MSESERSSCIARSCKSRFSESGRRSVSSAMHFSAMARRIKKAAPASTQGGKSWHCSQRGGVKGGQSPAYRIEALNQRREEGTGLNHGLGSILECRLVSAEFLGMQVDQLLSNAVGGVFNRASQYFADGRLAAGALRGDVLLRDARCRQLGNKFLPVHGCRIAEYRYSCQAANRYFLSEYC